MAKGSLDGALRALNLRSAGGSVGAGRNRPSGGQAPFAGSPPALGSTPARSLTAAPVALTILLSTPLIGGCAVDLRMSEIEDPSQATSTISYTSVRDEGRRFPDYGSIDASILDPAVGDQP